MDLDNDEYEKTRELYGVKPIDNWRKKENIDGRSRKEN